MDEALAEYAPKFCALQLKSCPMPQPKMLFGAEALIQVPPKVKMMNLSELSGLVTSISALYTPEAPKDTVAGSLHTCPSLLPGTLLFVPTRFLMPNAGEPLLARSPPVNTGAVPWIVWPEIPKKPPELWSRLIVY